MSQIPLGAHEWRGGFSRHLGLQQSIASSARASAANMSRPPYVRTIPPPDPAKLALAPQARATSINSSCHGGSWNILRRTSKFSSIADITSDGCTASGGKILNGSMEVPGGDWIVNAMDPQGAAFGLHAKKA